MQIVETRSRRTTPPSKCVGVSLATSSFYAADYRIFAHARLRFLERCAITNIFRKLIHLNRSVRNASYASVRLLSSPDRPDWRIMIRIIEQRQELVGDASARVFHLFRAPDGSIRGCIVPAGLALTLDMMAAACEHVAQSFLDALAHCEMEGAATLWVNDPLGLFRPCDRPPQDLLQESSHRSYFDVLYQDQPF
jgi:hypothetical protein